jgi:hypothetical protein
MAYVSEKYANSYSRIAPYFKLPAVNCLLPVPLPASIEAMTKIGHPRLWSVQMLNAAGHYLRLTTYALYTVFRFHSLAGRVSVPMRNVPPISSTARSCLVLQRAKSMQQSCA